MKPIAWAAVLAGSLLLASVLGGCGAVMTVAAYAPMVAADVVSAGADGQQCVALDRSAIHRVCW